MQIVLPIMQQGPYIALSQRYCDMMVHNCLLLLLWDLYIHIMSLTQQRMNPCWQWVRSHYNTLLLITKLNTQYISISTYWWQIHNTTTSTTDQQFLLLYYYYSVSLSQLVQLVIIISLDETSMHQGNKFSHGVIHQQYCCHPFISMDVITCTHAEIFRKCATNSHLTQQQHFLLMF